MRKNQKANQQRRKELNKYKGPVNRTKKKIASLNHSIKINIHFICLFAFLCFHSLLSRHIILSGGKEVKLFMNPIIMFQEQVVAEASPLALLYDR